MLLRHSIARRGSCRTTCVAARFNFQLPPQLLALSPQDFRTQCKLVSHYTYLMLIYVNPFPSHYITTIFKHMQSLKVCAARYASQTDALDTLGSGGPVVQNACKVRNQLSILSHQACICRNRQPANFTVLCELDACPSGSKFTSAH